MSGESLKDKLLSERKLTFDRLNDALAEKRSYSAHNVQRRSAIGSLISGLRHKLRNIDRSLKRCGPDDQRVTDG